MTNPTNKTPTKQHQESIFITPSPIRTRRMPSLRRARRSNIRHPNRKSIVRKRLYFEEDVIEDDQDDLIFRIDL